MTLRAASTLLVTAALVACGAPNDTSSADACTIPDPSAAPVITPTAGSGTFPSSDATGGPIASGTYYETAHVTYVGDPGHDRQGVVVFDVSAGSFRLAEGEVDASPGVFLGAYTTSGSSISLTRGCGETGTLDLGYTVSGGDITFYNASGSQNISTFTLQ